MTLPQIFALFWAALALGLGYVFARYPEKMESLNRRTMGPFVSANANRKRLALTEWYVRFYRVGGIVFMGAAVWVGIAAGFGLLR